VRYAPPQGGDDVVQRRSSQGRHDAHGARHGRQRTLARRIEQPFGFETRLALQELLEQRALPRAPQALDDQLQVAARFVHREAAAHLHLVAIARRKVEQPGSAAEHGAAQLARFVLEREVTMSTRRTRKTGDLATHGDRIEARVERVGHRMAQRADGPHARRGRANSSPHRSQSDTRGRPPLFHSAPRHIAPRIP
jgi:hypothetical protein